MQDEQHREKYILNFQNDQKTRNKELAYLMVVLDKYIKLDLVVKFWKFTHNGGMR